MSNPKNDPILDPPGWTFHVEEVSAGVYLVRGVDTSGRKVEATGLDPETLLADCKQHAARIVNSLKK
jgi:hypothetical protein